MISGMGLKARFVRSSIWSGSGFLGSQAIRLAANLILTRILFPEAFGLMALVTVFLTGLKMFSDIGLNLSIQQNKRGDETNFLNTVWTLQVIRGFLLWFCACALAYPIANFYGEPLISYLLPVAGIALIIDGFLPTKVETAGRHLSIGRVLIIEMMSQISGVLSMIIFALYFESVWALVVGAIITSLSNLILSYYLVRGNNNHFHWDRSSASELIKFGKWVFFSTVFGFLASQSDRLILGKFLTAESLGIYSIGFFIAQFPHQLGQAILGRVLVPAYRERPPKDSLENFKRMQVMRSTATGGLLLGVAILAFMGPLLIEILYDPRYSLAGGIVVIIALFSALQIIVMTYDKAALAAGDSLSFFKLMGARAASQTTLFIAGFLIGGLIGAFIGRAIALISIYPVLVWLARRHGTWDPMHDIVYFLISSFIAILAVCWNYDSIVLLMKNDF